MNTIKLLFKLYVRPSSAMSDLLDQGNWFLAAAFVLVVSAAFFLTINPKLHKTYDIPQFEEFYQKNPAFSSAEADAAYREAAAVHRQALDARQGVPFVGDYFFRFASFDARGFVKPLIGLSVFYVPLLILLVTLFGNAGSFGERLPREYGVLAVCTLTAWTAAHLPLALAGLLLYSADVSPPVYLAMWAASGVLFGVLMIFAVRTVFGANYAAAALVVLAATLGISFAANIFQLMSPWMLAPFLLFFIYTFFSGRFGSEISGWGTALGERQKAKRRLDHARQNPFDAAPHVQLGFIYRQRRQDGKAFAHFRQAVEIDRNEVEANYELGKLARLKSELQKALDHFAVVVEQNDRHALSEVWREIGATYLAAGMLTQARAALETFAMRRPFDAEGLYYLGKVLKAQSEHQEARDIFGKAVEAVKTSPTRRRREVRYWSKLARKEI
jgi:Tfp pilus assembly protein PilF